MMPIRRSFAELGPDRLFLGLDYQMDWIRQRADEELDSPITMADLLGAVEKCNKIVDPDNLEKYNRWMREFGSS